MTSSLFKVAMVAGESSGDLLAASIIQGIKQHGPESQFFGIGGDRMQAQGFSSLYPMDALSVFGYVDAIKSLPQLLHIRGQIKRHCLSVRPNVFVGIDAPDFNFNIERHLLKQGIPTVHFVSPSIWAWRGERIKTIKQSVSHMLVVFPFEEAIYQAAHIPVSYVGHPLASTIPLVPNQGAARDALGVALDAKVLALLPGSRESEVRFLGPRFLAAAERLQQRYPELVFLVPMANEARRMQFMDLLKGYPNLHHVKVVLKQSHQVLEACDAVIVASGTASLEAALYKRPMVISYVVSTMTGWLLKNKGYLPWIGLPNILHRDFVVPELIQDQATPDALAHEAEFALYDEANRIQLYEIFTQMHHQLKRNTAQLAAEKIISVAS